PELSGLCPRGQGAATGRLRQTPARRYGALSVCGRALAGVTTADGRARRLAPIRRARVRRVPGLRSSGGWLPRAPMPQLRALAAGGLLLQTPWILPSMPRPQDERHGRALGARGAARSAGAPLGLQLPLGRARRARLRPRAVWPGGARVRPRAQSFTQAPRQGTVRAPKSGRRADGPSGRGATDGWRAPAECAPA